MLLILAIVYAEIVWYLVKSGIQTYEQMDKMMKFVVGFNYIVAIIIQSLGNLEFAIICSLYQLLVFKVLANKFT